MVRRFILVCLVGTMSVLAAGCTDSGPAPPDRDHVPSVIGLTTREADARLKNVGLVLRVDPVGGGNDAVVLAQSPAAGASLTRGDVVTVRARCFAAPCPFPGEGKEIYDPCTCAAR